MKITANIAVHKAPKRVETLKRVVESLESQVDQINIQWNGFIGEELPQWAFREPIINSYGQDFSDNGKFLFLDYVKEAQYYLTCDSDILYPQGYVNKLIKDIEKHKCIVTYTGRQLSKDRTAYYRGKHKHFHHLQDLHTDQIVDVPGTGVMGFRTDYFCPTGLHMAEEKKMSDLVFAKYAMIYDKKIVCAKHSRTWLKSVYLKGIWHEFNEGKRPLPEHQQVKLMNFIQDEKSRKTYKQTGTTSI